MAGVSRCGRAAGRWRGAAITRLFLLGAAPCSYFTAHPFLERMFGIAAVVGIIEFLFVQWVAPFVSEFPERSRVHLGEPSDRAPMALMNMMSSDSISGRCWRR